MKYNRLTDYEIKKIIRCFVSDLSATQTSIFSCMNRNTINRYFNLIREAILEEVIREDNIKIDGEVELDESYFGAKRVRGKRGRGTAGKIIVFRFLKIDHKVYLKIINSANRGELMPIIQGKILEGSTIYTDGRKAYNGLIANGYDYYGIFHSENEFAKGKNHVNSIESSWAYAKNRMNKFNGFKEEVLVNTKSQI